MFSLYTYYCIAFERYKNWLYRRWYRSVLIFGAIIGYTYFFWQRADELIGDDAASWVNVASALLLLALIPFVFLTFHAIFRPVEQWIKDVEEFDKSQPKK